jgi:hypothetical protein
MAKFGYYNKEVLETLEASFFRVLGEMSDYTMVSYLVARNALFSQFMELAKQQEESHYRILTGLARKHN